MADITFNIHGGNVQVLPEATVAVQNIFGGSGENIETPLDPYIHDKEERMNYVQRITACPDAVTLCKTVLADLYNEVLADSVGSQDLIRAEALLVHERQDRGKPAHRHPIIYVYQGNNEKIKQSIRHLSPNSPKLQQINIFGGQNQILPNAKYISKQ